MWLQQKNVRDPEKVSQVSTALVALCGCCAIRECRILFIYTGLGNQGSRIL